MPQTDGGVANGEKDRAIFYHPDVLAKLRTETANRYQTLRNVMDGLQFDPWPPGAAADTYTGPDFARLTCHNVEPTTVFAYRVLDDRILIMFYEERKFERVS